MEKSRILPFYSILLVVSLLLSACAGFPFQEMSDARQAFEAAEQSDAKMLAPEQFMRSQKLLEQAESALDEGDYDQAKKYADESKQLSIEAREKAKRAAQQ
jgi:hypothetical protein